MAEKEGTTNDLWIGNSSGSLKVLLLIFSIVSSAYIVYLKGEWVWFSWHPTAMIFAFIFLAGFSILTKKAGGYKNTKIHGIVMGVATIVGCFGWYVIYSNKETLGKPHLVTLHAKIGVVVLVAYIIIACFSFPLLNPDWGFLRTNKIIRFCHKWSARFFTLLAWVCCFYGFVTIERRVEFQFLFALPLLLLAWFTLL